MAEDYALHMVSSIFSGESRDKERIERILSKIKDIWVKSPDLRLGQLLINASSEFEMRGYYYEDNLLELALDNYGNDWKENPDVEYFKILDKGNNMVCTCTSSDIHMELSFNPHFSYEKITKEQFDELKEKTNYNTVV